MKIQIIGIEASKGVGSKTGKSYDIGQIHAIVRLAPPLNDSNIAQGSMGSTYSATTELVATLKGHATPFFAEAEIQDVMRFGKREQVVLSVIALPPEKPAPVPVK